VPHSSNSAPHCMPHCSQGLGTPCETVCRTVPTLPLTACHSPTLAIINREELRSSTGLAAGLYNELGEDFTSTHTEDEILREMVLKFEQTRQFLGAKDLVGMAAISLGDDGRGTESDLGNGILGGHAYAFQSLHDLGNRVLMLIRNPWGSHGWAGDWGDNSACWTPELIKKVGGLGDDGDFFMDFKDLSQVMTHRYAATIYPKAWHIANLESEWTPATAGGAQGDRWGINPQFKFTVSGDPFYGHITLHQQDLCISVSPKYHTIGFAIWKAPPGESLKQPIQTLYSGVQSIYINTRDVSIKIWGLENKLEPGEYILVPTTFEPAVLGKFAVCIISNTPVDMQQIQGEPCLTSCLSDHACTSLD